MMRLSTRLSLASVSLAALTSANTALASNVEEFPDNGSEQLARGGAWVARASDPLAAFFNPAGLAGQDTRLILNSNFSFQHTCFTRVKATNDVSQDNVAAGASYPQVCNKGGAFPNPQIAFAYKVDDRIGLGFAVLGPSSVGSSTWPEFNADKSPAPERYLLTSGNALFFTPTLAIGVRVLDTLRVGASVQWGIATLQFSNASLATNDGTAPVTNDVKGSLAAKDLFVPGFTLGTIWSPNSMLDVAGWFKWSDSIKASGDVATYASYYRPAVATNGLDSNVKFGYTKETDCATGNPSVVNCGPNSVHVNVPSPMEAKLGFRLHKPVPGADPKRRDPLSQDVWDLEVDFTFANNQAFDTLQVRLPNNANGDGTLPVNGTGGNFPPNIDVPHHFRNVFGVRMGGDWNIIRDRLAIRAGVFGETNGQDPQYQNIDFDGAARFGLAAGAVYRLRLSKNADKKSALEFSLGYMHMFYMDESNNNPNATGIDAVAGIGCNPASNGNVAGNLCSDGRQKFRTNWPVNLGTITSSLNVLNVGVGYRF